MDNLNKQDSGPMLVDSFTCEIYMLKSMVIWWFVQVVLWLTSCFESFDIPKSYIFAMTNLLFYLNISSKEIWNIFAVWFSTHVCLMCVYNKKRIDSISQQIDMITFFFHILCELSYNKKK